MTLTAENMDVAKTRSVSHWEVKLLIAVVTMIVLITLVRHIQSGVGTSASVTWSKVSMIM